MPFFATMPITMIRPMNDEMLKVVPVTSSARNTPEVESSAEAITASGAAKLAELEQQHREHQHDRQDQHEHQVLERLLLLFELRRRTRRESPGGSFNSAIVCCTAAMPSPRFDAFEARRHRDVALQVLAADFGLARNLATVASEPSVPVLPVPLTSSVFWIASTESARRFAESARGWCRSGR